MINSNQHLNESHTQSSSSSSDEDEDESKLDSNIPDDEKFFIRTPVETQETIQPNNMMDIFRRHPSHQIETEINSKSSEDNDLEINQFKRRQEWNTSQHNKHIQVASVAQTIEIQNGKPLVYEQKGQETNSDENANEDSDCTLADNFSFLIAKGMLKPSSL